MKTQIMACRGKQVLVRLNDGTKFVEKFVDRTSTTFIFAGRRVLRADIKSMTPYRQPEYRWLTPGNSDFVDADAIKAFPNQCPITGTDENAAPCGHLLSKDGVCEEHGKVRLSPREKIKDDEPNQPRLYYYRRPTTPRGRILSRRRRNFMNKASI